MSNFDEALERFHRCDLEYAGGLANHGPMAAEALERLGHQALIPAFLGLYAPRLPTAETGKVLSDAEEAAALGDSSRGADWVATYEARLESSDWRRVLAEAVPNLTAGLFAGAGHGLLRTAHAARSLGMVDSRLRRRELARGLAYWSSRYQPLPGRPGVGSMRPVEALASFSDWPLVAEPESRRGMFVESVRRLDRFSAFAEAIEDWSLPDFGDLDGFLSGLCRMAARLYSDHPHQRIAYVHALTIPSALRLFEALLPESEACRLGIHAFQSVAAMHSIFGETSARRDPDDEVDRVSENWDEIRYHAASSLQEHSIKMVEACWRENQIREDPIFRRAAADAALKIDGRGRSADC